MSHAANLRQRLAANSSAPSKRRKLSETDGAVSGLATGKLSANTTQDLKGVRRKPADETRAAVRHGPDDVDMQDAISISSSSGGEEEDEEDDDDDDDDENSAIPQTNGHSAQTRPGQREFSAGAQERGEEEEEEDDDGVEPSFGDLLRSRGDQDLIDVSMVNSEHLNGNAALSTRHKSSVGPLTIPTATSLSTVLTQALRTNDTALLESCLQVPNLDSIRSTIERLSPSLASSLLQRLAERMHKRPGRAGPLMVWVQWTVVAHGGYLATQPAAMKQLHTLYNVVRQRATGLQPLLQLKGKLDMLEAQMQLRRNMQARRRDDSGDEGVIYVEADEDARAKAAATGAMSEDDDDGDMPQTLANGVSDDDDDEDEDEDEEDQDDEDDLPVDDEAEVTSDDGSGGSVQYDSADESDDDDDDDAAELADGRGFVVDDDEDDGEDDDDKQPAPKPAKLSRRR